MTDRPLLMSAPMVLGALKGWKTQTRRILKNNGVVPDFRGGGGRDGADWQNPECWGWMDGETGEHIAIVPPSPNAGYEAFYEGPYSVGDRLYVREAWRTDTVYEDLAPSDMGGDEPIQYEADGSIETYGWPNTLAPGRFRQGMHMPRWASRLTLVVTDVRVQRIQSISKEDAIAEGIYREEIHSAGMVYQYVEAKTGITIESANPIRVFQRLWDDLNADRGFSFEANPWVCAINFETHHCNIDQMGEAA